MIYLIGGSSHVGKTYFAQKLMEKISVPYISLDHLKMGFIRTGMTDLTVNDDREMRYFLFPYVAEIIKTAIENDQNLIIEGCYIPKEWKSHFDEKYLEKIKAVFIVMSEDYLRKNIDKVASEANVIEKRIADVVDLERLIFCSKMFKDNAVFSRSEYLEIDKCFDEEEIFRDILKKLEIEGEN